MNVVVVGSGSWGTALAIKSVLAGNTTTLYCRRPEFADQLAKDLENKEYLPGVTLPNELVYSSDLATCIKGADIILMVTPSVHVRTSLESIKPYAHKEQSYILCSKGVERTTGKLLTTVMREVLGAVGCNLAVLSGPNHAEEIGRDLPAASVLSTEDLDVATMLQKALCSQNFRIYANTDITVALGAQKETYAGLAGMGDLIATCMSPHGRNRAAGQQLADGKTMDYIINHTNMVVEGFFATDIIYKMACEHHIEMPITKALYEVLYEEKSPALALAELMGRDIKIEVS